MIICCVVKKCVLWKVLTAKSERNLPLWLFLLLAQWFQHSVLEMYLFSLNLEPSMPSSGCLFKITGQTFPVYYHYQGNSKIHVYLRILTGSSDGPQDEQGCCLSLAAKGCWAVQTAPNLSTACSQEMRSRCWVVCAGQAVAICCSWPTAGKPKMTLSWQRGLQAEGEKWESQNWYQALGDSYSAMKTAEQILSVQKV